LTLSPPQRNEVLMRLWQRAEWLKKIIENRRTKLNGNLRTRVYFANVECQIYKTILFGLRDKELDELSLEIEQIKKSLEARK
jgi:hypothetical protein